MYIHTHIYCVYSVLIYINMYIYIYIYTVYSYVSVLHFRRLHIYCVYTHTPARYAYQPGQSHR